MTGVQAQAAELLREIKKLEVVQMALEKQVPKKPISVDDEMGYFICIRCGGVIYYSDEKETHEFCLMCGQAIDWSDK